MIKLVLVFLLSDGTRIERWGGFYPSAGACSVAAQRQAVLWLSQHPDWTFDGRFRCVAPEEGSPT